MPVTHLFVPPYLSVGDTVKLIAPGGAVKDFEQLNHGVSFYEKHGLRVCVGKSCYRKYGGSRRTSRDDRMIAEEIEQAFSDTNIRAIFCVRGGNGCIRLPPLIAWRALRSHPKLFVGYSDISILHACLNTITGVASLHGPMTCTEFGDRGADAASHSALAKTREDFLSHVFGTHRPMRHEGRRIVGGEARGVCVGGNLASLCALCGTPYTLRAKNRILLLEEVNEPWYRCERMLWQLKYAGCFDKCLGVILGRFTPPDILREEKKETQAGLYSFFSAMPFPVIRISCVGHGAENRSVLLGGEVTIRDDCVII